MNSIIPFLESNNSKVDEFFSIIIEFPDFLSTYTASDTNINDVIYKFIDKKEDVLRKFNLRKEDIADLLRFLLEKGIELSFNPNINENSSKEDILNAFFSTLDYTSNDVDVKMYGVFDKEHKLYHSGDYASCMKFIADNDDIGIENMNIYIIEDGKQSELIF